jgi:arabinan endo-1,5-alpha-L-arabinosidase
VNKRKLRPVLDGEFWMIGKNPDLKELQGKGQTEEMATGSSIQECVDHHVFLSDDGKWHLWGCIRNTAVGRLLYHWEGESLTQAHWLETGEIIRVDHEAGESINDWFGQEWIQSPFVIKENNLYYMFYGGHSTGIDKNGDLITDENRNIDCQICLMTSVDGRTWRRHNNGFGQSRVFSGPGETRDPCILKINNVWHMYYAGYLNEYKSKYSRNTEGFKYEKPGVFVRTSEDLIHWSDYKLVHFDHDPIFGEGAWNTECPFVVKRSGYYYLFRTENYALARTHVFRSEDPYDFGLGTAREKYIGMIPVAAPEIIVDEDGTEYITSNHDLAGGTQISRLKWVSE